MAPHLRTAILTVGMALAAAAALPAAAQDSAQQRAWCNDASNIYSLDLQIGGCTALIQSGTLNATDLAVTFYNRGLAYQARKDYPRAIADFSEYIRINPHDADAFYIRGNAYDDQKDYPRAIADYSEAIRLNPQNAMVFRNRGKVELLQQRWQDAWNDYDAALRLVSGSAHALYGRGVAARRLGHTTEGDRDVARAVALDPAVAEAFTEIR